MEGGKERQCIRIAAEARIASARRRLSELRNNKLSGGSVNEILSLLVDMKSALTWEDDLWERSKQIIFLPVLFLVIIIVVFL